MSDFPVTVFHNPGCGTSRIVLDLVAEAGLEANVVEYLKAGWTRAQLVDLLSKANAKPRDFLRINDPRVAQLALLDDGATDDQILDAMVAHPVIVNRPIVVTPKGAKLCRPADRVRDLLP